MYLEKKGSGGGCKTDNDNVDLETVDLSRREMGSVSVDDIESE
jgi:hypothetical protein